MGTKAVRTGLFAEFKVAASLRCDTWSPSADTTVRNPVNLHSSRVDGGPARPTGILETGGNFGFGPKPFERSGERYGRSRMQARANHPQLKRLAHRGLIASIHFDGFRFSPIAYLTAVKWLLLGKRVRGRGQLVALLSKSPKAYLYWSLHDGKDGQVHSPHDQPPPIIALVEASEATADALEVTMRTLSAEGVPAIVISGDSAQCLAKAARSIDWHQEPWLLPLVAGDRLAPGAAAAYREAMSQTVANVLYADDDVLDRWQCRTAPHFKPDWDSELYCHHDYLTGSCIARTDAVGLSIAAVHGDWTASLVARSLQATGAHHVRQVLHHRAARGRPPRTVPALAISDWLPTVSIIIPTRNRVDLLRTCIDGVRRTDYSRVEIIVVDNDSDDPDTLAYLAEQEAQGMRVLRYGGAFNYSAINNYAVGHATGQLLCLLNNDIEVLAPDWLAIMATQAMRDDVGAVGAQLLYPDGRIQHAGVVMGIGNAAGHAHRFVQPEDEGYFRRHALPQFTSAVTGACLVVAKERFLAVGGLDEANFKVAFNDVDLCLKLNQRGWQSLYEPRAVLVHHESVSRGFDRDPVGAARFARELAALQRIWKTDEIVDPFHHPNLSKASEQFSLAL